MFDYRKTLLHLQLISGIGPATIEKLVQHLTLDMLAELYSYTARDFVERTNLSFDKAELLVKGLASTEILEKELALIERYAISWTTVFDDDYPALLKAIYLPPVILYWKGAHPGSFEKALAVVGARAATSYAATCAQLLLSNVITQGVCIVSGGALGADAYAHELALSLGQPTVAVIGSGLLKPYPAQNKNLFTRIIQNGGTLLSSFPLMTSPQATNFPARNRIIAGLSSGCLVLQAAVKSGALITARYALDQGREVGVVPGSITEPLSAGCHVLLSQGAHCITQPEEVFELLGQFGQDFKQDFNKVVTAEPAQADLNTARAARNTSRKSSDSPTRSPVALFCDQPRTFDEILENFSYEPTELHTELFNLQLSGELTQNIAGLWCAPI